MRVIMGRHLALLGVFFAFPGLRLLLWALADTDFASGDDLLALVFIAFIGVPLFSLFGLYLMNQCRIFHVDEEGFRERGILWGRQSLRWDEVREIGLGRFPAQITGQLSDFGGTWIYSWGSFPVFYFSRDELSDEQRLCMNTYRWGSCWSFGAGAHYGCAKKSSQKIIAAVARYCPGPKPAEFYSVFAGNQTGWEKRLSYVLRRKNADGEMEYSMHVVPKP